MKHCKKIISSVLVFALMGVPLASRTFAAETEPNEVKTEEQLSDQQLEKTGTNSEEIKNEENNKKGCQLWQKVKGFFKFASLRIFTSGLIFTLLYKVEPKFREFANCPIFQNKYGIVEYNPSKRPFLCL